VGRYRVAAALAATIGCASVGALGGERSPEFRLLRLDGHHVKWGNPEPGTGAKVTYAFVTGALSFPDAINCKQLTPLDGLLASSSITVAQLQNETAAAFALWQSAANISFERVEDPAAADILIGSAASPHSRRAHANVAYAPTGGATHRSITKSLICFDASEPWKIGFGGNPDAYALRYTLVHEIGHSIGLDHPSPSGELMSFSYGEAFRTLRAGDLAGGRAPLRRPPDGGDGEVNGAQSDRPGFAGEGSTAAPRGLPAVSVPAAPNRPAAWRCAARRTA
jgi:hypothetical protein